MTITVTKRIEINGHVIEESASTDLPLALDHDDVAVRVLVLRIALMQLLLPTTGEEKP